MNTRMEKKDLLDKIKANKDKHRQIFLEAIEGFKKKAIEILEQKIEMLKNGKKTELYVRMPEPEDHTKDYNRVIEMISQNLLEEIELTEEEFARYVLDDWRWKDEFLSVSNTYTENRYE